MKALRTASLTALATLMASPLWAQGVSSAVTKDVDKSIAPVSAPAEGSAGGLPQFNPHWWPTQILWLVITFTVMYLFFSKKTLPDITNVLDNRRDHIQSNLHMAEHLREQATATQAAYEKLITETRSESSRVMNEATAKAKAEADRQLSALQERGAAEGDALEQRLVQAKIAAKAEMQGQIAEIASAAAEKIVGIQPDLNRARTVIQALKGKEAA